MVKVNSYIYDTAEEAIKEAGEDVFYTLPIDLPESLVTGRKTSPPPAT